MREVWRGLPVWGKALVLVLAAAFVFILVRQAGAAIAAAVLAFFGLGAASSRRSETRPPVDAQAMQREGADLASARPAKARAAEDAASDAAGREKAAAAAAGAENEALGGWTEQPNRKPPRIFPLILIGLLSVKAAGATDCVRITGPDQEMPAGFGYWRDLQGEFFCPCAIAAGQYHDATRLPGGCLTPPDLPLIAYRLEDSSALWADLTRAGATLEVQQAEIERLRLQRTQIDNALQSCGANLQRTAKELASLQDEPDPPSRLTWFAVGAGAATSALVATLLLQ